MAYFTSNTYQMKREILTFSNKFSRKLPKPERKFIAEMNYGILASKSCLLTDIVDQLHETSKKINIVDRLSHHLAKGTPREALKAYLTQVKKWCPAQPVIHIDDSDVVKPDGYKFESLGWVRDGSESTATKNLYKKGYHVTEATVLTNNNHPLWSGPIPCLEKRLLSWTVAMMITRCFSSWIPWDRTMSYALLPNVSCSTIINGLLQRSCVTVGKEK
ncbi:MAG: hypothetical protein ACLSIP_21870 [Hungatella sp.]